MHNPYEFKPEDAKRFAEFVGIKTRMRGGQLEFRKCPYCRQNTNDKNTFAISLETGQFQCLRASCNAKGNMLTLARDFDFSLGTMADEYYRPRKQYRDLPQPKDPIEPKPEAISYLTGRGISEEVIKQFQITVQIEHPEILVFPFYDENGKMVFVKYRKTDFVKGKDKAKEWAESGTKPILFGMMQAADYEKPLVLTEGQIDSLSVATAGIPNAISVPTGARGFTWLPYCWNWMHRFSEIIIFGDHENGHITLLDELKNRLNLTVRYVQPEDYKDCKDANDILRKYGSEQVRKCIENAKTIPIEQLVELSEVEDIDIFAMEKLKTGLKDLDYLLYGGIPFGGITLISGKPGEGKSTLASQILISAIQAGHKCFAYSGELPNGLFKAWMRFQIVGRSHISEYQNSAYGMTAYKVSDANKALVNNWLRDKCLLYDTSAIDGDETEDLVNLMEKSIQQYGTRVMLLDNLMTAMDIVKTDGTNQYEKQSKFMKRLARLAMKYNVLILLVAHKRKNNFSSNENDEISGSGDIANLAMVTIAYEKGKDLEEGQRLLKVSKNRLFGRVKTDGWIVDFDEKSRRIYGSNDDPDFEYGWNTTDGFDEVSYNEPFFD